MAFRTALMMLVSVRFSLLVVFVLAHFAPFVMLVIPMVPIVENPKPKPERRPRLIVRRGVTTG
jgi:hypothetical protein